MSVVRKVKYARMIKPTHIPNVGQIEMALTKDSGKSLGSLELSATDLGVTVKTKTSEFLIPLAMFEIIEFESTK